MAIIGFEIETCPLTDEEKKLVPIIIKGLANKDCKEKAMYGSEICKIVSEKYHKLSEPRLRKITNFLRAEGILPVIATSKGYYVSYDKEEIQKQIDSLEQRIEAMNVAKEGLKKWL
jgi:DNA-binding PadR family transcriptional regulator